ncbi:MAG: 2-hydroxyglutaryl-CoA dehydratase [Actinobacteria bacterium]|jgi:predicted CoA-substrate-specific enzyme activase|nr:2-hydroxyglutaryl-CoA dehydratase [Actinomycetota bacterium]MBT3688014.1 2-hydroxyglutaryl-CoA dehydratase [Actinomycetota bacterium]MBT4036851.1 2-hydroxyglutaryl-CoA dehydratase [Actinomycetota bacterium]MBT4278519.1 2-hydroxyglutaryl-CoA dehydratase [Actinomycetota bacterium]MBT4343750.1 2-hydroxyglutaryl-CoA dehydratase [Actinomycetota bacterium]
MTNTAGIDVGSTYTKAVILAQDGTILGRAMGPTGFQLRQVARTIYDLALEDAGLDETDIAYVIATGAGRHQVDFKDLHVTDLTACARGSIFLFPGTRTILDVGGQTMKASRVDESAKVISFRLNDKCAAGTGAFLEKTARYMGYETTEIGALMTTSKGSVPISGVCAVFAESEVINHLSLGTAPADIMQGAIESLTNRSVQLMKRVRAEPEFTLIGGILRFETMSRLVSDILDSEVNVPDADMVQHVQALGCALLGHRRLEKIGARGDVPATAGMQA